MTLLTSTHPFAHIMSGPYKFVGIRDAEYIGQAIEDNDSMMVKPEENSCIRTN